MWRNVMLISITKCDVMQCDLMQCDVMLYGDVACASIRSSPGCIAVTDFFLDSW